MAACNFCADFSPMRSSVASCRGLEIEQIRRCAHPVAVHQLLDELVAEPLDVERAARGEMLDLLLALRRDRSGRRCSARRPDRPRAPPAIRTPDSAVGSATGSRACDAALGQHPHHLRNDVAGAANHHRIADAHVLARQFIHVVQRRVAHRDAADEHRLQPRHRRQRAGAARPETRCRAPS